MIGYSILARASHRRSLGDENHPMMRNSHDPAADRAPQRGGDVPRRPRSRPLGGRRLSFGAAAIALAAPVLVVACAGNGDDQVTHPVPLGMSSSLTAFYSDGELTLYQVARPVPLPVRKPTSAESSA